MEFWIWPIQTECQATQTCLFEMYERFRIQQRCGARSHGRMHSFACRIFHQLINVRTLERISTRKDEDWWIKLRDVVDQSFPFKRAELERTTLRLSGSPAVKTCKIAGTSNFPDHYLGGLVQIEVIFHRPRGSQVLPS